MKVLVTGAAGFLGQKLATALLNDVSITDITLTDIILPRIPVSPTSKNVAAMRSNLTGAGDREKLISRDLDVIFVLHGIMSGRAETHFESGMSVNFDSTRGLLDLARKVVPGVKVIFASSLAVFGGEFPEPVTEETFPMPTTSYGMEKMLCEYLINDYSRRNFIDGRILRFPTIVVRPGVPSGAASSFVSGIIREPLNNQLSVLPVSKEFPLWVCSPRTLIANIMHSVSIPAESFGAMRQVNVPGITVTVGEILDALVRVAGEEKLMFIEETRDEAVERIVGSWPAKFDISRAVEMGFQKDGTFDDAIQEYIEDQRTQLGCVVLA